MIDLDLPEQKAVKDMLDVLMEHLLKRGLSATPPYPMTYYGPEESYDSRLGYSGWAVCFYDKDPNEALSYVFIHAENNLDHNISTHPPVEGGSVYCISQVDKKGFVATEPLANLLDTKTRTELFCWLHPKFKVWMDGQRTYEQTARGLKAQWVINNGGVDLWNFGKVLC